MKKIYFIITLLSSVYSFGQFPPEFPKKIINKVFCGTASTSTPSGSMYGKHFLDFPYRLTIYEDSLFVEYNPGARWKEDKWGKTQTITELVEWKREPDYTSYNELRGYTIRYKVPYSGAKHSIKEISIWAPINKPEDNQIRIEVYNSTYDNAPLYAYESLICQTLKSKEEIKKEEEERIKLENQKKDADKLTIQSINDLFSKNAIEEAAKEYSELNFENSKMKSIIQKKLDAKYGSEEMILIDQKLNDYIINNSISLIEKEPKIHNLKFDKNGTCSDYKLPKLDNVPADRFGEFFVYKNSKAELKIELKDSILVSSTYSTSYTKPLFIDKKENFYYKTKTGLPVATISNDPSIDKKTVRINKVYKREKYANGILIDTQEFKTEKTVGIMKKDQ